MKFQRFLSLFFVTFLLAAGTPVAFAAGTVGTGIPASCTEAALDAALAGGGLVTFDCGAAPVVITITGPRTISANTTMQGADLVTLDGGSATNFATVNSGADITLDHIKFSNFSSATSGGVFNIASGSATLLTVNSVTFLNNNVSGNAEGGAIYFAGGAQQDLTITNSQFATNSGKLGGAVSIRSVASVLNILGSTFSGNVASAVGGAIYTQDGNNTAIINTSLFSANAADEGSALVINGGGVNIDQTTFETSTDIGATPGSAVKISTQNNKSFSIHRSTFSGNTGRDTLKILAAPGSAAGSLTSSTFDNNTVNGGAVIGVSPDPSMSISNVTVSNNTLGVFSAGVSLLGNGTLSITNSTIIDNSPAQPNRFGITGGNAGALTVQNSVLAFNGVNTNCSNAGGGSNISLGHNIEGADSCGFSLAGDLTNTDPLLLPLALNGGPVKTRGFSFDSPAFEAGAGPGSGIPGTDARNIARPQSGAYDIGAFEAQASDFTSTSIWDGGGADDLWSTAQNWQGDVVPVSGNHFLFPAGALQLTNTNDFPIVFQFGSLNFFAPGYDLHDAGFNAFYMNGSINDSASSGTNTIISPVILSASPVGISVPKASHTLILHDVDISSNLLNVGGNGTVKVNGVLSGNPGGTVAKYNSGVLELNGANTATGTTLNINGGQVYANGSSPGVSVVFAGGSGFLGGSGTVESITHAAGTATVDPGTTAATATMTAQNGIALGATAVAHFDLRGAAAGSGYDQLVSSGAIDLGNSTLQISLGSYVPPVNQTFTIFQTTGALTGTLNGLADNAIFTVGSNQFRVNYYPTSVVLTNLTDASGSGSGSSGGGGGGGNSGGGCATCGSTGSSASGTTNQTGTVSAVSSNTNQQSTAPFFHDISGHWALEYIENLRTQCNVDGYKNAGGELLYEFHPDATITRAEFVIMLMKCGYAGSSIDLTNKSHFADVRGHWAEPYIALAESQSTPSGGHWVDGYPDGNFQPNRTTNRAEAMKMALTIFQGLQFPVGDDATPNSVCRDIEPKSWYAKYFFAALNDQIINGYKDSAGKTTGLCGPGNLLTRAEAAKILTLLLGSKN